MNFIVLEGLDGAGKSTQVKLLTDYLNKQKIKTKFIHFPQVESKYFGELISRFLRGDFGKVENVNPYLVALLYAGDQKNASQLIQNWLSKKYVVIADRYIFSNIAYQCAKLKSKAEKIKLREWILDFEFNYYKIPQPDINIFLDVPFQFTQKNLTESRNGNDRKYLKGKNDIHEENLTFQQKVRDEYISVCNSNLNIKRLQCYNKNNEILTADKIFKKLIKLVIN